MKWLNELFKTEKPIIAMLHLKALPGDPNYDEKRGMAWIIEEAQKDLEALQIGGVDAVMFSNESSLPYLHDVESITTACMARIIGELRTEITSPFGVNVLWDPSASIDLAVATGALFVREIFTGVYASDFGLWDTNCGKVIRHRNAIGGSNIRLLFNIVPEAATYLGKRSIQQIAKSTVFNTHPDGLCISGLTAGEVTPKSILEEVKKVVQDIPIFANTGVCMDNIEQQLSIVDGAIVGTAFKRDGYIWNEVDVERVKLFMAKVRNLRQH